MHKLLREIEFGEPDANAEYFMSLRSKIQPMYIRAYHSAEIINYNTYFSGEKFIVTGQKGTGKTAILRYMEQKLIDKGYSTEFIVFKNEISKEAELLHIDYQNINGTIIEEDRLRKNKFYYHSVKRVMISLILSKIRELAKDDIDEANKGFISSIIGQGSKDVVRSAFESIVNIIESAEVNVSKISKGLLNIDPGQLIKKANDDLLSKVVKSTKRDNSKIRIFFDEMHFAFRDKESLKSDAALVRDTILAAQALNERFAEENIDVVVYLALRREFLDQPEIAQADVVHVVESYGESISWEHYPSSPSHPVFDFISLRFRASLKSSFSKTELFHTYMKEIDPVDLLEYTWSKPRDLVRFFKVAQNMFGKNIVISPTQYKSIIRTYSSQAWRETKSALGAFVPVDALPALESGIKSLVPGQYDGSQKITEAAFQKAMKPAFYQAKKSGVAYTINEFCDILYIMGIYYYTYVDANGRLIFQQYHRGNTSPTKTGEIKIHAAIAKALS